jgi:hypothetical protein
MERDPLTGNSPDAERAMYVRYHGLTPTQADELLTKTTHKERDELFSLFMEGKKQ